MQPAERLRRELGAETRSLVDDIDVFELVDSTNSHLMRSEPPGAGRSRLALADDQSHGRGRHDRRWETAPGSCLCLSLAYTFERTPDYLAMLTLLMGVAAARVLDAIGLNDVQLKWPNDIVVGNSKLGGMLAETQLKADRCVTVVAGIGINLRLPPDLRIQSTSAWAHAATDLASCLETLPDRDVLAARISDQLVSLFRAFDASSIDGVLDEWRTHDWLLGRRVRIDDGDQARHGVAAGIDEQGVLLLESESGVERVVAGTITLADGD